VQDKVDKNILDRSELLHGISNFKPTNTIFEARLAADSTTKEAVEAMRAKRLQHNNTINREAHQRKGRSTSGVEKEKGLHVHEEYEPKSKKQKVSCKDTYFFISNTPTNMHAEKGLQIHEKGNIGKDAILDLAPDDQEGINSKRRITKWDRKKHKFIQEDPREKLNTLKDKRNFYVEWQKRTHGRIQAAGEEESSYAPQYEGPLPWQSQLHNKRTKQELRGVEEVRKCKEKHKNLEENRKRGMARRHGKLGSKKNSRNQGADGRGNRSKQFVVVPPKKRGNRQI